MKKLIRKNGKREVRISLNGDFEMEPGFYLLSKSASVSLLSFKV
jgi:hypothetical protein